MSSSSLRIEPMTFTHTAGGRAKPRRALRHERSDYPHTRSGHEPQVNAQISTGTLAPSSFDRRDRAPRGRLLLPSLRDGQIPSPSRSSVSIAEPPGTCEQDPRASLLVAETRCRGWPLASQPRGRRVHVMTAASVALQRAASFLAACGARPVHLWRASELRDRMARRSRRSGSGCTWIGPATRGLRADVLGSEARAAGCEPRSRVGSSAAHHQGT